MFVSLSVILQFASEVSFRSSVTEVLADRLFFPHRKQESESSSDSESDSDSDLIGPPLPPQHTEDKDDEHTRLPRPQGQTGSDEEDDDEEEIQDDDDDVCPT